MIPDVWGLEVPRTLRERDLGLLGASTISSELLLDEVLVDVVKRRGANGICADADRLIKEVCRNTVKFDHKWRESRGYIDGCSISSMGESDQRDAGDQEVAGLGIRPAELVYALWRTDPDRFSKCPFLHMLLAVGKSSRDTQRGCHYSVPYRTRKVRRLLSRFWTLDLSEKGGQYFTSSLIWVHAFHFCVNLIFFWFVEMIDKVPGSLLRYLEILFSCRRSQMKAWKDLVQPALVCYRSRTNERVVPLTHNAATDFHPGTFVSVPLTNECISKGEFRDGCATAYLSVLQASREWNGSDPLVQDIVSELRTPGVYDNSAFGLLESAVELTGFRRGPIAKAARESTVFDTPPLTSVSFQAYKNARELYRELLALGGSGKELIQQFRTAFTYPDLLKRIRVSKSAGMRSVDLQVRKWLEEGREVTGLVPAQSNFGAPLEKSTFGEKHGLAAEEIGSLKSTKKGAILLALEGVRVDIDILDVLDYLKLGRPGSVGTRFVPFKDPRLIFMIPLVIHAHMSILSEWLSKGVERRSDIFIFEEKGSATDDHYSLSLLTRNEGDEMYVPICLDWATWDQSLYSEKVVGLIAALAELPEAGETVACGVRFLPYMEALLWRSTSGIFNVPSGERSILVQAARLASGDALTSIRGSVENLAQLFAMEAHIRFILTGVSTPTWVHGDFITLNAYDASMRLKKYLGTSAVVISRTVGQRIKFRLAPCGDTTMGDDVLCVFGYRFDGLSGDDRRIMGQFHALLALSLAKTAEMVGGRMNRTKQLPGPHQAVFVRKFRAMGEMVPRFNVTPICDEGTRTVPVVAMFRALLSRASEWCLRGASWRRVRNVIISLWGICGRETFDEGSAAYAAANEMKWVSALNKRETKYTKRRHTVMLGYEILYRPPKDGGVGYFPFCFESGGDIARITASRACPALVKGWTNGEQWLDIFSKKGVCFIHRRRAALALRKSFPQSRHTWRQQLDDLRVKSANDAHCLVKLEDRYGESADRGVAKIVDELIRPDEFIVAYDLAKVAVASENDFSEIPISLAMKDSRRVDNTYGLLTSVFPKLSEDVVNALSNFERNCMAGEKSFVASFRRAVAKLRGPSDSAEIILRYFQNPKVEQGDWNVIVKAVTGVPDNDGTVSTAGARLLAFLSDMGLSEEFSVRDSLTSVVRMDYQTSSSPEDLLNSTLLLIDRIQAWPGTSQP